MKKGRQLPNLTSEQEFNEMPIMNQRIFLLRSEKKYTQQYVADCVGVSIKTYRSWEKGSRNSYDERKRTDISIDNLFSLATFYNVSIDYIIGKSDFYSPENDFVGRHTGLSDNAIKTLETIKFRSTKSLSDFASRRLDILNYILTDGETFEKFLDNLTIFIDNKYQTPVFWDPEKHCYINTGYKYANGEIGLTLGHLVKDNKGNDSYETLGIGINILESHAMLQIEHLINKWKDSYRDKKAIW